MRISDWSSDVCSSDLAVLDGRGIGGLERAEAEATGLYSDGHRSTFCPPGRRGRAHGSGQRKREMATHLPPLDRLQQMGAPVDTHRRYSAALGDGCSRSEEHTSELQSLMRISYAV